MVACAVLSVGAVLEQSGGRIAANNFHYLAAGLEVGRDCNNLVLAGNTYTALGSKEELALDIVNTSGGGAGRGGAVGVISLRAGTDEAAVGEELRAARPRPCPYCGQRAECRHACHLCNQGSGQTSFHADRVNLDGGTNYKENKASNWQIVAHL